MMPKRVAETDPNKQITDYTGSGPFIFKKDEWRPGEKAVYVKNPKYKPRSEPASGLAGGKVAKVDRVEWIWIPDPQTQVNALLNGEIDLIETPPHDLLPLLAADKNIELVDRTRPAGSIALRFNVLHKPFDNPKVRQAVALRARPEGLPRRDRRRSRIVHASASRCSPAARRSSRPRAGRTSSRERRQGHGACCRRRATTARRSC